MVNTKPQNKPLNILLADDDKDDCFFFEKALGELSIATHLIIVNNGEELMEYLTGETGFFPDIIFLDISMPRKTGFECLSEIKENDRLKDVPVVMFTISFPHNKEFETNLKKTLTAMGAHSYISKNSDFNNLKQVIQEALTAVTEKKQEEANNI